MDLIESSKQYWTSERKHILQLLSVLLKRRNQISNVIFTYINMLNFHAIPTSSAHNCSAVELQLFQPIFTKVSCIAFITIYILLWFQSKPSKLSKYKFFWLHMLHICSTKNIPIVWTDMFMLLVGIGKSYSSMEWVLQIKCQGSTINGEHLTLNKFNKLVCL